MAHQGGRRQEVSGDEKVTLQEVALTNLDVRDKMWNVRERASHS